MITPNPEKFWNDKIVQWEQDRYEQSDTDRPFMEKFVNKASSSLRHRLKLAEQMISAVCAEKRVVEIGCGSGRMAETLIKAGAQSYTGYDISEAAINAAQARVKGLDMADRISFQVSDVNQLPELTADIVVSLGLFDWLGDEALRLLFQRSNGALFLHSFSEKRLSIGQLAHRLYVQVAYGYRTGSYRPHYQSEAELTTIAHPYIHHPVSVYRDKDLAFGAFLMTLHHFRTENV